jgi:hypothetical protein
MQEGLAQWEYNDKLADLCGTDVQKTPLWRMQMAEATGQQLMNLMSFSLQSMIIDDCLNV